MKRLVLTLFSLLLVSMLNIQSADAAKKGSQPGGHLSINEVFYIEGDPDTLLISGKDFDFGDGALVVSLGDVGELNILNDSATEIDVEVPNLPAGNYQLTVFREGGQSQGDEFDLTVGAVGPQGPEGPRGPQGPEGPQGPTGSGCSITQCSVLGTAAITCGSSPSVEIPCTRPKFVFLSKTVTTGAMGGVSGADTICSNEATGVLPGRYTAWLSTSTENAKDRISTSMSGWQRPDGVLVASDLADLTDGTIAAAITVAADGSSPSGYDVWTGTLSDGTKAPPGGSCVDWTSAPILSSGVGGVEGLPGVTDSRWTNAVKTSCTALKRLYCFEQ